MIRSRYPENWEELALQIKDAAEWKCEACGRPCQEPGESLWLLEQRVKDWPDAYHCSKDEAGQAFEHVRFAPARFRLTVAHLDHDPTNSDPANLKAWCTPCHARNDIRPEALARKRYLRAEWQGQLPLPLSDEA